MTHGVAADRDFIAVRPSAIHGTGVFAKRPIPRGTRIIEYKGRRLAKTQLLQEAQRGERMLTYVLNLDAERAVDGAEGGNDARFVNHSCEPNCEIYVFDEIPYVYAMQDIPAGAELTFDYNLQSASTQRISIALSRQLFPCRCGAAACRGTMVAPSPKRAASGRKSRSVSTPRSH
jgi:SET domain-containing protein